MYFLKGGGCQKSDIPVIDDFRFGKTVNEPKTLGTTGVRSYFSTNPTFKNPLKNPTSYLVKAGF